MADRGVAFTNLFNFRDLGGLVTADGRSVRRRRLYRSDDLSRISGEDAERFAELGIQTVIDLRRPTEIDEVGRIPQLSGFAYHHVFLDYPTWPAAEFANTAQRAAFVRERYLEILSTAGTGVGRALRLIADAEAAPLVFHCMAGKDRTGVLSAVTLSLLGVPDADIADDYQLSEAAEEAAWTYYTRTRPELGGRRWKHITVNPRDGMLGVLTDLRAGYGSVAGYAESVGVTAEHITAMRAHLLLPD